MSFKFLVLRPFRLGATNVVPPQELTDEQVRDETILELQRTGYLSAAVDEETDPQPSAPADPQPR